MNSCPKCNGLLVLDGHFNPKDVAWLYFLRCVNCGKQIYDSLPRQANKSEIIQGKNKTRANAVALSVKI